MTLATTAAALYLRAKAQLHHLTRASAPQADHNHPRSPIVLAFPFHATGAQKRRRPRRPLATAIRRLLPAYPPAPPGPLPPADPAPASLPPPSSLAPPKSSCRLCAADTV
ncbi:hypothetical protein UK23_37405 [Lentzea aerocolonigenes]|uniref:Uncharacterized protein n=1 Tax=Lentzea aerocolonigenes TaxID=68170 RepID=A0A0F0GG89_LENAE|nr:hypothetical protein [Lentzea aerocolonigenes]KJK42375.1 hypothetical protein UK23_37405 [Lentzea aerocolonigenes]